MPSRISEKIWLAKVYWPDIRVCRSLSQRGIFYPPSSLCILLGKSVISFQAKNEWESGAKLDDWRDIRVTVELKSNCILGVVCHVLTHENAFRLNWFPNLCFLFTATQIRPKSRLPAEVQRKWTATILDSWFGCPAEKSCDCQIQYDIRLK